MDTPKANSAFPFFFFEHTGLLLLILKVPDKGHAHKKSHSRFIGAVQTKPKTSAEN